MIKMGMSHDYCRRPAILAKTMFRSLGDAFSFSRSRQARIDQDPTISNRRISLENHIDDR